MLLAAVPLARRCWDLRADGRTSRRFRLCGDLVIDDLEQVCFVLEGLEGKVKRAAVGYETGFVVVNGVDDCGETALLLSKVVYFEGLLSCLGAAHRSAAVVFLVHDDVVLGKERVRSKIRSVQPLVLARMAAFVSGSLPKRSSRLVG